MPFLGKLEYVKIPGESPFGRPQYKLTQPFSYSVDNKDVKTFIHCETGFVTDFASIPEWIPFINPKDGKWRSASVIHDKALKLALNKEMRYKEADLIFYHALREDGSSLFTANLFYFWVRLYRIIKLKLKPQ